MIKTTIKDQLVSFVAISISILMASPVFADEVEIVNLYDAFGHPNSEVQLDHGLSVLVRYKGKTILFDSGTNADILERNTKALGIDLKEVDMAIASHAHLDHTGGFHYLLRQNPDLKIYYPHDTFGASAPLTFNIAGPDKSAADKLPLEQRYFHGESTDAHLRTNGIHYKSVVYVKEHTEIAPGINLISTESDNIGYFTKYPGVDLEGQPVDNESSVKYLGLPELSLSLNLPKGEVLLVGCSHSGVEKIVETTKEQLGEKIHVLAGGFHLLPYQAPIIQGISNRLKKNFLVENVAPAHCTGHLGFGILSKEYDDKYHFFGLGSRLVF